MLVTIKLLGELGRKFGREWNLDVETPAEAIRALSVLTSYSFRQYLADNEGAAYRVVTGDAKGCSIEELHLPCDRLIIAPVISGQGGGFGRVLLGGALLGASFFMPATISIFGASITSMSVGLLGASMILGGVHQMLSPQPKMPKREEIEKKNSFLFSNTADVGDAGLPVPIAYGTILLADPPIASIGVSTVDLI